MIYEQKKTYHQKFLRFYLYEKRVDRIDIRGLSHLKFIDPKWADKIAAICNFYGIIFVELVDYDPTYSIYIEHKDFGKYTIENSFQPISHRSVYFLSRAMTTYYYPGLAESQLKNLNKPIFSSYKVDTKSKLYIPSVISRNIEDFRIIVDTSDDHRKYYCGYCRDFLHYHPHGN